MKSGSRRPRILPASSLEGPGQHRGSLRSSTHGRGGHGGGSPDRSLAARFARYSLGVRIVAATLTLRVAPTDRAWSLSTAGLAGARPPVWIITAAGIPIGL